MVDVFSDRLVNADKVDYVNECVNNDGEVLSKVVSSFTASREQWIGALPLRVSLYFSSNTERIFSMEGRQNQAIQIAQWRVTR